MSSDTISYPAPWPGRGRLRARLGTRLTWLTARPELLGLAGLAAVLNLWNLSVNGWSNSYYAAAVRSMSTSWHNFLFASLDPSGLMTVDKPPLSLWVQALSVRVFGFHPLSILVPEALMGVVAVALVYDLTQRRFGRAAGFVAGLTLATTPITVAIARHNNPDEVLIVCCVAALWAALRALDTGRTRWLILAGVCVGLGFEAKMGVALMVVPGIAAAWVWMRARGRGTRLVALRQLFAGGAAMVAAGGAWPLLVTLTPAADRPWISGTSDNSIWSLIFGYNGLGRVSGQSGGPGGGAGGGGGFGGALFGGATGPFRLLQSSLGDQAGWLLGFAAVSLVALVVLSRLRRRDPRTGWLIAVGGAFITSALVFSFSQGIFHPYYVSFLAPFVAALVGAGAGVILPASLGGVAAERTTRVIAPIAIAAGAVTEVVVLTGLGGQLSWAKPVVIAVAGGAAALLALRLTPRLRAALVALALAALLAAPATWAVATLGHAENGTFPAGGSATSLQGGPGGAPGPVAARGGFAPPGGGGGFAPPGGGGGFVPGAGAGGFGGGSAGRFGGGSAGRFGGGFGAPGGGFGGSSETLSAALRYAKDHGGGTVGISSQSSAAASIISSGANVAGLGGFSGRESSVTASWLATEVRSGHLRWVIVDSSNGMRLPSDNRTGSQAAMNIVEQTCRPVTFRTSSGTSVTMYDCLGRAAAIAKAGGA